MSEQKNRWAGLVIGPAFVFVALGALWNNETRFDYHEAARQTEAAQSLEELVSGQRFSLTGHMDQELVLPGEYVASFTGYLKVHRSAEIYAWDRDTDSDHHETWSRRWMSSVESNSRNSDIHQQLSSRDFTPAQYQVGDLTIDGTLVEFVDKTVDISPVDLEITDHSLHNQGQYLYLSKGRLDNLGDERVDYWGIPAPATATYFGKAEYGKGIADTTEARSGMIHALIQDSGILHHIVAGDRDTALATMAAHLSQLKWIVRGVASAGVIFGFTIFFGAILGFLYPIPIIGSLAQSGAFILSLALGIPLILITIAGGFLVANPLAPLILAGLIGAGLFALIRTKKQTQAAVYRELEHQYGSKLQTLGVIELEFVELAKLALVDGRIDPNEESFLRRWSRKQGWKPERFEAMLAKAKEMKSDGPPSPSSREDFLKNLIRLALADGKLSRAELDTIRHAATRVGYERGRITGLIQDVQKRATAITAQPV